MGDVLVLNSGSSSIKFALFGADLSKRTSGSAVEIGGASSLVLNGTRQDVSLPDHVAALEAIFRSLEEAGVDLVNLAAAAHRVVHGGRNLRAPCLVTPDIADEIGRCSPLAPLHNPHNLAAIRAVAELAPNLPQCVSFDTAFHASNPDVARRYAIPDSAVEDGLQRYGFHGISYESLVLKLPELSANVLPDKILAMHLGNGASLCAIGNGRSVATTMGYSPLEGLTMGTRSGSIDANVVLKLVADHGLQRTSEILNKESGLLGLGGESDMRKLHQMGTTKSEFAIDHFCYWAVRHAGSMIAAMGGLDAIVFTGGIGENDAVVRRKILEGLAWLGIDLDPNANASGASKLHTPSSKKMVWIVPAEEEEMIARSAQAIMEEH
ncbi:acetate kinase [Labrenzia sp. EL_208]|nr:acetate kinase [Labrenzia sp. EL_132]MBG6210010.1 acetate kinase [Labrenzia sp. EL_126]MBG6231145.1 acetate kinase [Labrenzia sp. EL_208]MCR9057824.1 acetate/propionate family kinase [Paracoccaceae bacterium]